MFFFPKRYRALLTALSLFVLSLAVLSWNVKGGQEPDLIEKTFLLVVSPFLKAANSFSQWTERTWSGYLFLTRVRQENISLTSENRQLRAENDRLRELAIENERLRKLLEFKQTTRAHVVSAQVVGRDSSSWFKTVLIDKGHGQGLRKSMPVFTHEGLVGQVLEVGENTAKILLIIDYNSAVDAMVQRSRAGGICEGRTENLCELKYVVRHEDVEEGDMVITSGLGRKYPKGLIIGKVSRVIKKRYGMFQHVEVTPAVDFSKLEEVLVALSVE